MSSDVAIRVENLGKMYRIGGPQARYSTFRETLTDAFAAPFRRAGRLLRGQGSAADLDQHHLGPQGRHLRGQARRGGRHHRPQRRRQVAPCSRSSPASPSPPRARPTSTAASARLLEVGTGFHPELTGRENIYLNGAILGMRRAEIDRKFDEIVAFAEIEKFLDTPVKHYSSGHVRAAGLRRRRPPRAGDPAGGRGAGGGGCCVPEEVPGQDERRSREQGRTVLFVSHNMAGCAPY